MTRTQTVQNSLVSSNTEELPSPDATITNNTSDTNATADAAFDVADTGRINFGAAARLPVTGTLPRPNGSVRSVADRKRISLGAAARLPASK